MKRFLLGFLCGALTLLVVALAAFWSVSTPAPGTAGTSAAGTGSGQVRASTMRVDAVIPYAALAQQVGNGTQLYAAGSGRVGISRHLDLLGRSLSVRAEGAIRPERDQVVVRPDHIDIGDGAFTTGLSSWVADRLTVRESVPGLPRGLHLTDVRAEPDGVHTRLDGREVPLG